MRLYLTNILFVLGIFLSIRFISCTENIDNSRTLRAHYFCQEDTWTPVGLEERTNHTAIWTGSEMIIWGGGYGSHYFNNGAKYNPETNVYVPLSTKNAPSPRFYHTAIWTGSVMIVWGGSSGTEMGTVEIRTTRTKTFNNIRLFNIA